MLLKATSRADWLQLPCITLAVGLLWVVCVCGRHASYFLNASLCSNVSVWQLETLRPIGIFEVQYALGCSKCADVKAYKTSGRSRESNLVQLYPQTYTIHAYLNSQYFYWSWQSPQPRLSGFVSEKNIWLILRENSEFIRCYTNIGRWGPKQHWRAISFGSAKILSKQVRS